MFPDIPHSTLGIAQESEGSLALASPLAHPPPGHLPSALGLQESWTPAKASLISTSSFRQKKYLCDVKTQLSCHILQSKKGDVSSGGRPLCGPRHRAQALPHLPADRVLCARGSQTGLPPQTPGPLTTPVEGSRETPCVSRALCSVLHTYCSLILQTSQRG